MWIARRDIKYLEGRFKASHLIGLVGPLVTKFRLDPERPAKLQPTRGPIAPRLQMNFRGTKSTPDQAQLPQKRHENNTLPFPSLTTATTLYYNDLRLTPASFPRTISLRPDIQVFEHGKGGDYESTALTIHMRGVEIAVRAS